MPRTLGCFLVLLCIGCMAVLADDALAVDVDVAVSSKQTYVELPVTLEIRVSGASDGSLPEIPEVDGLKIESTGRPMVNSQVSIINGRRTANTTRIYRYEVTPLREGDFTIGPIPVSAGGVWTITKAVRLTVEKSETGDLMFAEIASEQELDGKSSDIYVGQAVDLVLRIWVQTYQNDRYKVAVSESDMWRLFSERSRWGKFAERLNEMAKNRQRPGGRVVERTDNEGELKKYFLYEIQATIYPTRPGPIDVGNVKVVFDYPTAIGPRRDSFSSLFEDAGFPSFGSMLDDDIFNGFGKRLAVTGVRPLLVEAELAPIEVQPIPTLGRPDNYRGAVGEYSIVTEASPATVKVGDPITLNIGIDGTGPMDLVLAPPLANQPDLAADFKVPDEKLAGFVDGDRKVFSTTIRPRREGITQIPPIEFSYFDPGSGEFVTTKSNPIRIQVEPADVLSIDAIVGAAPANRSRQDSNDETATTSFFSTPTASMQWLSIATPITPSQPNRWRDTHLFGVPVIGTVLAGPLLFAAACLFASRRRLTWFTSAKRQRDRRWAAAQDAGEVVSALTSYLAARWKIDASSVSRDDLVGRLRTAGQSELAIRLERLAVAADKSAMAEEPGDLSAIKTEARSIAEAVEQSARPRLIRATGIRTAASIVMLILVGTGSGSAFAADVAGADEMRLSIEQQNTLIAEAKQAYERSLQSDAPESVEFAETAAAKLEILVAAGIRDKQVFANLGNAYRTAGQPGRAIANYRRALRIDPTATTVYGHLVAAQVDAPERSVATRINDTVLAWVKPSVMRVAALGSWVLVWLMLALPIFLRRSFRPIATALMGLLAIGAAASYLGRVLPLVSGDSAVLVGDSITIRQGDGIEFEPIVGPSGLSPRDGQLVTVTEGRSGWTRIETRGGMVGWVDDESIERI